MPKRHSLTDAIKVLLIEDSASDADLLESNLSSNSKRTVSLVRACNLSEGLALLDDGFDVVFLDLGLPDSAGLQTYRRVRQKAPLLPIIILTIDDNDELAYEALRNGASDLLVKSAITPNLITRSMMYAFERHHAAEAHDWLRAIAESSRDAIIGQTPDGEVTSWNKGAERIYGYRAEEVIGKPIVDLMPPEFIDEVLEYLEKIKKGETVPTFETMGRRKSGEPVSVSINVSAIRNSDGIVTGVSLIARDTSLQTIQRRDAEQAAENFKLAAAAARLGIWTFSGNRFHFDNRCLQMFGVDRETFDGSFRSFMHLISEKDRTRIYVKTQGNIESNEEFEVNWPDGTVRDILATGREYFDGSGVRTWAGICMDVTEARHSQRQASLLKLLQQREEFMATLTHDLKNPLIAVKRLLELLIGGRMGPMTDEQTNLMVQLRDTNSGVLDLIKNLLDIYREEQQALGHCREQTDVRELVEECVSQFEPIAQMRCVQIRKHVPNEPVSMLADSHGIRRVLQNLLDNAIKFSEADGEINVKLARSAHEVIIEIEDNGKGVPLVEQERLFQRFSQGSEGRKYTDGSGLGLYLCRRLVEAHGGTIDYVGQVNQGAKFRVSLPVAVRRTLSGEFRSFR